MASADDDNMATERGLFIIGISDSLKIAAHCKIKQIEATIDCCSDKFRRVTTTIQRANGKEEHIVWLVGQLNEGLRKGPHMNNMHFNKRDRNCPEKQNNFSIENLE